MKCRTAKIDKHTNRGFFFIKVNQLKFYYILGSIGIDLNEKE